MTLSINGLLYVEGTLETQLALTCLWAAIWFLTIRRAGRNIFQPWIASKPWKQRWLEMNDKTKRKSFNVKLDPEDIFEFSCEVLAIICQHALGGFLCLPSVLGFEGPVVQALACHGALCEAGWEFQDLLRRLYEVKLGTEKQKRMNPPRVLLIIAFHHAMGLGMVIPMNIAYGNNSYYHELVFLMQGAAFVASVSQNYGYTLDVHTPDGLAQMRVCVSVTFFTMLWSRVLRYVFIGYKLISAFYADGHMSMFCGGGLVLSLMGLFNCLMIMDGWAKFSKFMMMKHTAEEVPEANDDTSERPVQRQTSNSKIRLCSSQRQWAKVRGVVRMCLMKEAKKQR